MSGQRWLEAHQQAILLTGPGHVWHQQTMGLWPLEVPSPPSCSPYQLHTPLPVGAALGQTQPGEPPNKWQCGAVLTCLTMTAANWLVENCPVHPKARDELYFGEWAMVKDLGWRG